MDSLYLISQNYTQSSKHFETDRVIDAINNASWALSYPGAVMISNCTYLAVESLESGIYFTNMYTELFENLTWGQQLEVFLLHFASNSLEYRIMSI